MALDEDALKKLSPKERLKKLKEFEEERKKDLEQTEELLKETEEQIAHEENIPDIEVPQIEPVDISRMFEAEEGIESKVSGAPMPEDELDMKYTPKSEYDGSGRTFYLSEEKAEAKSSSVSYESVHEELPEVSASKSAVKQFKMYKS